MKFGKVSRWRTRPPWVPEWAVLAAPTVAVVAGTSLLVGVLPAVIATGTRYILLITVAAAVPFLLLLLMGALLALLLPREAGPSGGGGSPPPSDGPPEPPWWPAFEKAFRQHAHGTHDLAGTRPGGGDDGI